MPILSKSPPLHLYKVCFEERWQGKFEDLDDALNWGREVAETGRLVYVVDRGVFTTTLLAVYPESRVEEGVFFWRARARWAGGGG
jgi:hypothetical protein